MRRWPWFAIAAAVLFALSPPGQAVFHAAFLAGEQLTRNIWRPRYLTGLAAVLALALIEWYVRYRVYRRRGDAHKGATQRATES
jgi:hypothetical protein